MSGLVIDPTDTVLVTGLRKTGKTHFVQAFLMPHIRDQGGRIKYHRSPGCIKKLENGYHHVIDDFDSVPMREIAGLCKGVQAIATAGRHSGTGLTIIVHHPTFTTKEFRLTPDHVISYKQPSVAAAQWLRTYFASDVAILPELRDYWALYYGPSGRWLIRVERQGQSWIVRGLSPSHPPWQGRSS